MSGVSIRELDAVADRGAVAELLAEAADYALLAEGAPPGPRAADDFFTQRAPGAERSVHLGVFVDERLSGLAEISVGFPAAGDAFLGLMLFAPRARGLGLGAQLLAHVEALAREAGAPALFLGVLEANPRARAFWEREGFRATGITRVDRAHIIHRLVKPL